MPAVCMPSVRTRKRRLLGSPTTRNRQYFDEYLPHTGGNYAADVTPPFPPALLPILAAQEHVTTGELRSDGMFALRHEE